MAMSCIIWSTVKIKNFEKLQNPHIWEDETSIFFLHFCFKKNDKNKYLVIKINCLLIFDYTISGLIGLYPLREECSMLNQTSTVESYIRSCRFECSVSVFRCPSSPLLPVSLSECVVRTDSTSRTVLLPTLAGQWSEATPRVWRCFTWKTEHFQFYQNLCRYWPGIVQHLGAVILTNRVVWLLAHTEH